MQRKLSRPTCLNISGSSRVPPLVWRPAADLWSATDRGPRQVVYQGLWWTRSASYRPFALPPRGATQRSVWRRIGARSAGDDSESTLLRWSFPPLLISCIVLTHTHTRPLTPSCAWVSKDDPRSAGLDYYQRADYYTGFEFKRCPHIRIRRLDG